MTENTDTLSPVLADLKALSAEVAALNWSVDEYGTVVTPDGRTVEMNGFATICGYGDAQKASKARTRTIVAMTKAFPSLLTALEEAQSGLHGVMEAGRQEIALLRARAEKAEQRNERLREVISATATKLETSGWMTGKVLASGLRAALSPNKSEADGNV